MRRETGRSAAARPTVAGLLFVPQADPRWQAATPDPSALFVTSRDLVTGPAGRAAPAAAAEMLIRLHGLAGGELAAPPGVSWHNEKMSDKHRSDRIPPHQQLLRRERWPVVGEVRPRAGDAAWSIKVSGLVQYPQTWSLDELESLPHVRQTVDIHCVTRWSKLDMPFEGVPLREVLVRAQPLPNARFVSFIAHSERGHSTSLPLAAVQHGSALLAFAAEGRPLTTAHGGPLRLVVPGRYFYKSVKWLAEIELLAEDRLGYWEAEAGYHNEADPWREQRFLAPQLSKQEAARLIAARDFSHRDLRGIDASQRDLTGLVAHHAKLRDANFSRAILRKANFFQANLSGAHFDAADLRQADLRQADVEGAEFRNADLRAANLCGASLFGATFCDVSPDGTLASRAHLDASTQIDAAALSALADPQADFVAQSVCS